MLRKYSFLIGFLFLLFAACDKEDVLEYQLSEDCIQFDMPTEAMSGEYNFAEQTYEVPDGQYTLLKYYGDSLLCDTLRLPISIIGWEQDYPRNFKLTTTPVVYGVDTLELAELRIDSTYTLGAGLRRDSIDVIFMRPEAGERLGVGITFDLEGEDAAFDDGAVEQSVYALIVENTYEQSYNWDNAYLGEFSQAKAAFIVTHFQQSLDNLVDGYVTFWSDYNRELREALAAYNEAHPDAPKDFTFPVNSMPMWWFPQLGEYSDAKDDFMREYLGDYDMYMDGTPGWDWLSLYLSYYYEQTAPHEFANDFRQMTQPDWWDANAQYLGEWSIPKALMIEWMNGSFIWQNGSAYNWGEQVVWLISDYDRYFSTTVPEPPYFDKNEFKAPVVEGGEPTWWSNASRFLGAYSDAKKEFLISYFDPDGKNDWWNKEAPDPQYAWGPQMAGLIAYYNEKYPDGKGPFENDFSLYGDWKPAEPDWWKSNFLGAYSDAKKEFLISYFDPDGKNDWWNKVAPDPNYAWGPQMAGLIDYYNQLYPDDKGPFENDFSLYGDGGGGDGGKDDGKDDGKDEK